MNTTSVFEVSLYFAIAFAVSNSFKSHGKNFTATFFIPLLFLAFLVEETAVSVFKGFYYPGYNIYILHVPLAILFGWCAIIYIAYTSSKNIFGKNSDIAKVSFFAAIIGVTIDLFLEPLAYFFSLWVWNRPDIYFNASFENFISWFIITFTFTAVFSYVHNSVESFYKRMLLMHVSSLIIVVVLIFVITFWKLTINL